jgi:hypothetical protein
MNISLFSSIILIIMMFPIMMEHSDRVPPRVIILLGVFLFSLATTSVLMVMFHGIILVWSFL